MIVVYDLDNTLVDSSYFHYTYFKRAFRDLFNLELSFDEFKEKYFGKSFLEIIREVLKNRNKENYNLNEVINYISKVRKDLDISKYVKLKDDSIPITLEKLKNRGVRLTIYSNSDKEIVYRILNFFKLLKYFDFIITSDLILKPKPDPEGLMIIEKTLKDKIRFLVGDSIYDCLTAKNYNVDFILYYNNKYNVKLCKPNYVIKKHIEILNLLQ